MKNEFSANEAMMDYNQKEWECIIMNQREQNNRDNHNPRNQGKPSRQRKEARENKRFQG